MAGASFTFGDRSKHLYYCDLWIVTSQKVTSCHKLPPPHPTSPACNAPPEAQQKFSRHGLGNAREDSNAESKVTITAESHAARLAHWAWFQPIEDPKIFETHVKYYHRHELSHDPNSTVSTFSLWRAFSIFCPLCTLSSCLFTIYYLHIGHSLRRGNRVKQNC